MANINLHKSHAGHFSPALTVLEILIFLTFDLENLGQGYAIENRTYAIL